MCFSPHFRPFRIIAALVSALLAVSFSLNPGLAEENSPLRVGVEDYYPPFSFPDEKGRPTGFDPSIAAALCTAMGRSCDIRAMPFDALLTAMRNGEVDLLVAGLAANEDRKKYMDFSESYYHSRTIYIGKPGIAADQDWMEGKRLGAQADTQQASLALNLWKDVAKISLYRNYGDLLDELYAGNLDIIISDGLPGYDFLRSERGENFIMLEVPLSLEEQRNDAHIGVRKNAPGLLDAVNKSIHDLKLYGEYDRIARRYFPFSIY